MTYGNHKTHGPQTDKIASMQLTTGAAGGAAGCTGATSALAAGGIAGCSSVLRSWSQGGNSAGLTASGVLRRRSRVLQYHHQTHQCGDTSGTIQHSMRIAGSVMPSKKKQ